MIKITCAWAGWHRPPCILQFYLPFGNWTRLGLIYNTLVWLKGIVACFNEAIFHWISRSPGRLLLSCYLLLLIRRARRYGCILQAFYLYGKLLRRVSVSGKRLGSCSTCLSVCVHMKGLLAWDARISVKCLEAMYLIAIYFSAGC